MKHTALTSLAVPVALGLAIMAAGCKGEEKKPAPPPPPPPRPVERPQVIAPEPTPPPPAPPPKKERTGGKVVKSVHTAQGKLTVVKYGKGKDAEFGVMLGKGTLVEPDFRPVEVATSHPKGKKASLVLLRFPSKDKACPAHFRVADVTRGKEAKVSDEFGNCSAKPKVSSASGGWKLAFPKAGSAKPKTWTYSNGELREAGQKNKPATPDYTGPQ